MSACAAKHTHKCNTQISHGTEAAASIAYACAVYVQNSGCSKFDSTCILYIQDAGLKAIANLEEAFKECDRVVEQQDKQAVPSVQQNALNYVGQLEEAMVKAFPFEVPKEYDNLPQLKVRSHSVFTV